MSANLRFWALVAKLRRRGRLPTAEGSRMFWAWRNFWGSDRPTWLERLEWKSIVWQARLFGTKWFDDKDER